MVEELKALRVDHPDHLILFRSNTGNGYMAWGDDAVQAAKILHLKTTVNHGDTMYRLAFQDEDFIRQLLEAGKKVAVVEKRGKETVVNEVAYAEADEEQIKEEPSVDEPKVNTPPKPKRKPKAAAK
jgi:DNA mismatch repair ATPase MutS